MAKRQIVLMKPPRGAEMEPLGPPREVVAALAGFNTAPDGSKEPGKSLMTVLYGPGFVLEFPWSDEVNQAMVTLIEENVAWPVLMRLCKATGWKMMDMESGRVFG